MTHGLNEIALPVPISLAHTFEEVAYHCYEKRLGVSLSIYIYIYIHILTLNTSLLTSRYQRPRAISLRACLSRLDRSHIGT